MDGKALLIYGEEALGGLHAADHYFYYECLDKAAEEFIRATYILKSSVDLTMVADQQIYALPADFVHLYAKQAMSDRYVGRYTSVAGSVAWPVLTSQEKIFTRNKTTSETPLAFTILDPADPGDPATATTTAAGAATGGECVLTDAAADFTTDAVAARWRVQNLTDGSHGIVLSAPSATTLRTALFGGTNNAWAEGDSYVLTPYPVRRLQLEAPAPEDGATLTLPYLCLPAPVFSEIGRWRIPRESVRAICREAAYQFQQEFDRDSKLDGHLHQDFLAEISRVKTEIAQRRLQGSRYNYRR